MEVQQSTKERKDPDTMLMSDVFMGFGLSRHYPNTPLECVYQFETNAWFKVGFYEAGKSMVFERH